MRIAAAVPNYPPGSRVGSWISTHECLARLAARGHDVVAIRQLGRHRPDYTLDGVQVLTGAGRIERTVPTADVAVSHLGDSGRAHAAAVKAGVPSVRMAHGGKVTPERLDGASLVVWNAASYAEGKGWAGPSIVVHPPVWPDQHRTTPGDLVTLVNLSEDKGVRTFWRCAERLPDLGFLGVRGSTGHQQHPRPTNVEVVRSTRRMRDDVWCRTRLLLMPSAFETYGRVGVEAMCSGIPVIAHPTPGLRESLGDAGTFIDRDDHRAWAAAIERLMSDDDAWHVASQQALARVDQLDPDGDLDRFADAIEALSRKAVAA